MIEIIRVDQFGGFGNDTQKRSDESFRMRGFTRGVQGIVTNKYLYENSESADFTGLTIGAILNITWGKATAVGDATGVNFYSTAVDNGGQFFQSLAGALPYESVHKTTVNAGTMGTIVDQKGRLLYSQEQYLGMFTTATNNYVTGTVSVTNGSATVTGSGTTFVGNVAVDDRFRINGDDVLYKVSVVVSNTELTLSSSYSGTTASGASYSVNTAWEDKWKDWGSTMSSSASSRSTSVYTPMELYEDTVLVGRNNNIVSLNTVTDTITTDAVPAFNLPDGFDIINIMKGTNGVLIVGEFAGKVQLVLWDNYSDRAIAPWIEVDAQYSKSAKWNGGWLIVTGKAIYYTNGYSLTLLKEKFLDTYRGSMDTTMKVNTAVVVENTLVIGLETAYYGKRRFGVYELDLSTLLFKSFGRYDGVQLNESISTLSFINGQILYGSSGSIGSLELDTPPPVSTFISNPLGNGDSMKVAEGIRVPISIATTEYPLTDEFSFTITARITKMDRALQGRALTNALSTSYLEVHSNGSVYKTPEVGDEVEFLTGDNASVTREVVSIVNSGTATEVWTLDRVLDNYVANGTEIIVTPFETISVKSYTNLTELKNVYFGIKQSYRSKKFMIKLEITDATRQIEIHPFYFIYNDEGVIE